MLEISELDYRIAGRPLFEGASAVVPAGHRVGLVGRNGTGKSTLLKLVTRELEPDGGAIRLPRDTRIGIVSQEAPGGDATPVDVVLAADTERAALLAEADTSTDAQRMAEIQGRLADIEAHAAPARAAVILAGLGFDATAQAQPMSSFSGGWRMRVALAAALFAEPDLLLLDEPTNHLDFEAATWLEGFLRKYPKTLVMVSHDRDFLNAVVTGILHLERNKLFFYSGDYDTFRRVREERLTHQAALAGRQEAERKRIQAFIDRFKAKATKARQAQSRVKALARMSPIEIAARDETIQFHFPEPEELPPPLVSLDRASVGYEPGRPVLRNLDLRVDPDDRIALLGANGNGKSTLVKLLAGRLKATAGGRHASGKLRVGYFAQHQVDELDLAETALQQMARVMHPAPEQQVRARLGRFGFGQNRAETKVGALSGGEKARLTLALITHHAPNLLILDEPTNHLDIEAREALIEGLAEYSGAVIVVSHDSHLVELIADRLWLVADGTAKPFEGDVADYRRLVLGKTAKPERPDKPAPARPAPPPPAKPKVNVSWLKRQARDAEALVAKLTAEKEALEKAIADPDLFTRDRTKATDLMRRQAFNAAELEAAETRWLELAAELESAGA